LNFIGQNNGYKSFALSTDKDVSSYITSSTSSISSKEVFSKTSIYDFYTSLNKVAGKKYLSSEMKTVSINVHKNIEIYMETLDKKNKNNQQYIDKIIELKSSIDNQYNSLNYAKTAVAKSGTWRYGDVLYYGPFCNNGNAEKSLTGHTAILSTTDKYVIEAATTSSNGAKVFHWSVDKLWKEASGVKQYKIASVLGKDASESERKAAVKYGLNQVGETYSLKTTLDNEDKWYCSKLTCKMWDTAGYNLRPLKNYLNIGGYLIITPNDIAVDANTWTYKNWDKTDPTYA
jgi:hypothetical protein